MYLSDTGFSQIKEFTVAAANTIEEFSLTFSANTSNIINDDNGAGIVVNWPLVAGTNFQVAADTWASGEDFATSNQQNLLDSTANNVLITGVKLETGSAATAFQHESYGDTLAKCLRYYYKANNTIGVSVTYAGLAVATGAARFFAPIPLMRADPVGGNNGTLSHYHIYAAGSSGQPSAMTFQGGTFGLAVINVTRTSMTAYSGAGLLYNNNSAFIDWDAEL